MMSAEPSTSFTFELLLIIAWWPEGRSAEGYGSIAGTHIVIIIIKIAILEVVHDRLRFSLPRSVVLVLVRENGLHRIFACYPLLLVRGQMLRFTVSSTGQELHAINSLQVLWPLVARNLSGLRTALIS